VKVEGEEGTFSQQFHAFGESCKLKSPLNMQIGSDEDDEIDMEIKIKMISQTTSSRHKLKSVSEKRMKNMISFWNRNLQQQQHGDACISNQKSFICIPLCCCFCCCFAETSNNKQN